MLFNIRCHPSILNQFFFALIWKITHLYSPLRFPGLIVYGRAKLLKIHFHCLTIFHLSLSRNCRLCSFRTLPRFDCVRQANPLIERMPWLSCSCGILILKGVILRSTLLYFYFISYVFSHINTKLDLDCWISLPCVSI